MPVEFPWDAATTGGNNIDVDPGPGPDADIGVGPKEFPA